MYYYIKGGGKCARPQEQYIERQTLVLAVVQVFHETVESLKDPLISGGYTQEKLYFTVYFTSPFCH